MNLIEVEVLDPVDLFVRGLIDEVQAKPEPWRLNADRLLFLGWNVKEIAEAYTVEGHLPETAWAIARSALDRWSAKYPQNTLKEVGP
ncbi:MAG: hypothetical protein EOM17_13205 [Synergistales bacterium]|nr:hypothetical protein [Synergistales bacterium]